MFTFILDRDLTVYDYTKPETEQLVFHLGRTKHTLELSSLFQDIWQDLWMQGLDKATEITYIVGENASFTDNRILFIWIKSWRYFGGGDYYCTSSLNSPKVKNPEAIEYLREPRITIKGVFSE